jgi:hypothetical protein
MGDENGDDYMSVSAYSQKRMPIQIQLIPTAWLLPRTVTEESKIKSKLLNNLKISIISIVP